MKIITVQFDYPGSRDYEKLLRVFARSVAAVMPAAKLEVVRLAPPTVERGNTQGWASNTAKLVAWDRAVRAAQEPLVLCDCDILALRDVSDAFDLDFDIAYTERGLPKLPLNGGVVFVRPTDRAKGFFAEWRVVNDKMYRNKLFHAAWRKRFVGMNQASFGYLMSNGVAAPKMATVPCATYNACEEHWPRALESARLVHVKGKLRTYALDWGDKNGVPHDLRPLVAAWRAYL